MKKSMSILCGLIVAFCLCGCGKSKATLHLYSWADYFSPDVIKQFEKEFKCRVVYDTFDSNEALLAKLQAGATGYDVIVPSHYIIASLVKDNMLLELDKSRLGTFKHLDPEVVKMLPDPDCQHAIPYMMSYTGIGYNNTKLDTPPDWQVFARSDFKGRMTLLDDMREVIGAALCALGLDANSTNDEDLAKARELVMTWRANIAKFENEQYKNGIASNEFYVVMGYSGDLMQVVDENPHVSFTIPKDGCLLCCDMLAIPSNASNSDLAYQFLDFIHRPDIAAANTEHVFYCCPNKDAYPLLSDDVRNNPAVFIDPDIFAKSKFTLDLGENLGKYTKLWDEIKAGK